MLENIQRNKLIIINSVTIFFISVFVNRGYSTTATSLGEDLQKLSDSLPNTQGFLQPQRILLPLFGKIANINLQILNLIFVFLFIFFFYKFILEFSSNVFSFLLTSALSATMFIQFTLTYGGYPDILSYIFLLLVFQNKEKKIIPYVLFFLALLTKETVIFTIPFFLSLKEIKNGKIIISFFVYLPLYFYLSNGTYSPNYFVDLIRIDFLYFFKQSSENILIGYFSSIKFLWLYILINIWLYKDKILIPFLFLNLGIFTQFFLGGDSTRFVSFIFLIFLIIAENMNKEKINYLKYLLVFVLLLNTFTPKYYVYAYGQLTIPNESRLHFIDFGR